MTNQISASIRTILNNRATIDAMKQKQLKMEKKTYDKYQSLTGQVIAHIRSEWCNPGEIQNFLSKNA